MLATVQGDQLFEIIDQLIGDNAADKDNYPEDSARKLEKLSIFTRFLRLENCLICEVLRKGQEDESKRISAILSGMEGDLKPRIIPQLIKSAAAPQALKSYEQGFADGKASLLNGLRDFLWIANSHDLYHDVINKLVLCLIDIVCQLLFDNASGESIIGDPAQKPDEQSEGDPSKEELSGEEEPKDTSAEQGAAALPFDAQTFPLDFLSGLPQSNEEIRITWADWRAPRVGESGNMTVLDSVLSVNSLPPHDKLFTLFRENHDNEFEYAGEFHLEENIKIDESIWPAYLEVTRQDPMVRLRIAQMIEVNQSILWERGLRIDPRDNSDEQVDFCFAFLDSEEDFQAGATVIKCIFEHFDWEKYNKLVARHEIYQNERSSSSVKPELKESEEDIYNATPPPSGRHAEPRRVRMKWVETYLGKSVIEQALIQRIGPEL